MTISVRSKIWDITIINDKENDLKPKLEDIPVLKEFEDCWAKHYLE